MSVNCMPSPHVQSMIWATDQVGMELLLYPPANSSVADPFGTVEDAVGFGACYEEFAQAIHAEVGATAAIRGAGYNVSALMAVFRDQSYLDECSRWPFDLWWDKFYFGTNIHPYETLFVKANRNVDPVLLELMAGLHVSGHNEGRSWELCK